MTQNQIAFYKAKEERRHNIRTEGQTDTSISENVRHNKATEAVNWYSAKTGAAVGFAQAAAAQAQAAAAQRQAGAAEQRVRYDYILGAQHNANEYRKILQDNQINWAKQNETERHNQKMESLEGNKIVVNAVTGGIGALGQLTSGYAKIHPLLP